VSARRPTRAQVLALGLSVIALLSSACITTDIRSGEDNRPPRIPSNQADPKPGLVVVSDAASQLPMQLKVLAFEEPNAQDTLYVRWFVDYHRQKSPQLLLTRAPEPARQDGTRTGSTFTLTLEMLGPSPATEPHIVEVVVCDRQFDDSDSAPEGEKNRRCAGGDAFSALLSWTVQVAGARVTGKPQPIERTLPKARVVPKQPAAAPPTTGRAWPPPAPLSQREGEEAAHVR
jgi:hypothetical protein